MKMTLLLVGGIAFGLGVLAGEWDGRSEPVAATSPPSNRANVSLPSVIETTAPAAMSASRQLHVNDIRGQKVLGELGVDLGVAVRVKGVVIAGHELGFKAAEGRYFFRVTEVEGKKPEAPLVMALSKEMYQSGPLADNPYNLSVIKYGKKHEELTAKEKQELEEGYVGKEFQVVVYETGKFDGFVDSPYEERGEIANDGFWFRSCLAVMGEWK